MFVLLALLVGAGPVHTNEGPALFARFECHRCHEGTGLEAVEEKRHCVRCHRSIIEGRFDAPAEALARWQKNIVSLPVAPSLAGLGRVLRRDWLETYLQAPHDLRPHLLATMPRLPLKAEEAKALAKALVTSEARAEVPSSDEVEAGRAIYRSRACAGCHDFSAAGEPYRGSAEALTEPIRLAPDLRFVRQRFQAGALVPWLLDPAALRPEAKMQNLGLSKAEAKSLASFLWHAPLTETPASAPEVQRAKLDRKVGYAEVEARVFRKVCWHCHSSPDYNRGDGGPGNTGGFGFAARGLDLSSYESTAAGVLNAEGNRRSIFAPDERGVPLLLAVLLARREEERGFHRTGPRGMPLGFPSLTDEQIQLVETWIAQGRPR